MDKNKLDKFHEEMMDRFQKMNDAGDKFVVFPTLPSSIETELPESFKKL